MEQHKEHNNGPQKKGSRLWKTCYLGALLGGVVGIANIGKIAGHTEKYRAQLMEVLRQKFCDIFAGDTSLEEQHARVMSLMPQARAAIAQEDYTEAGQLFIKISFNSHYKEFLSSSKKDVSSQVNRCAVHYLDILDKKSFDEITQKDVGAVHILLDFFTQSGEDGDTLTSNNISAQHRFAIFLSSYITHQEEKAKQLAEAGEEDAAREVTMSNMLYRKYLSQYGASDSVATSR